MKINLHIERLVVDGILLSPGEYPLLQAAIEAEFTRRLANGNTSDELRAGRTLSGVQTAEIQLTSNGCTVSLGEQISGAVYGAIGK